MLHGMALEATGCRQTHGIHDMLLRQLLCSIKNEHPNTSVMCAEDHNAHIHVKD